MRDPVAETFKAKRPSEFEETVNRAARDLGKFVADYRFEVALLAGVAAAYVGLDLGLRQNPVTAAAQLTTIVLVALFAPRVGPQVRGALSRGFMLSRVRRRWDLATRHCEIPQHGRIVRVEQVWSGQRLHLRIRRGGLTFDLLAKHAEALAAALRVANVHVSRDPRNAARGAVTLIDPDPTMRQAAERWPALKQDGMSLWDPIPIGTGDHGGTVDLTLIERNVLIGGQPGAGKSAAMSLLLATAALDPTTKLILLDGKEVELSFWADRAAAFCVKVDDAIIQLTQVQAMMDQRFADLRKAGLRKVPRDDRWPLYGVFVDELALFTAGSDRKVCGEFSDRLRDIVARGRAAGVIVVAATQKPGTDTIPSALHDLFAYRWAMACSTPEASDTILGRGWASRGFDAATIPAATPGVGLLLAEDGTPVRMRSFYLDDNNVKALAERARKGRV